MSICESCKRTYPEEGLTEVRVTAVFWNRKNEWITYFCPRCLDYIQKQEEIKWLRKNLNSS